jgi:hypothetical protein
VASLDRRIEALEKLYAMSGDSEEERERRAGQHADFLAKVQAARERAEREASEKGDLRRLRAIQDLERHILEREEQEHGS